MAWLNNMFGGELSQGLQLTLIFGGLLIALLLVFWLFRKIFGNATTRMGKSRQPRLSVTDAAVVDDKRRLILVRRDNVEHLVMIGGPSDVVIEQAIVRAAPVSVPKPIPTEPAKMETPSAATSETKSEGFFAKPATAVGAGVAAAGAGLVATANSGASSAKEMASDSVDSLTQSVSSGTQKVTEVASETAASLSTAASERVEGIKQAATTSIFDPEPTVEPAVELTPEPAKAQSPEPSSEPVAASVASVETQTPTTDDISLDLTDDLEDALGLDSSEPKPTPKADDTKPSKTEDEMQRLLDDLAAGN